MRGLLTLVAVGALACALSITAPERAQAGHDNKNCGIVSKGKRDYRVRAMQMSCRPARRGVLRYLRKHEARPGFNCSPAEGRTKFYCSSSDAKAYWAVRL